MAFNPVLVTENFAYEDGFQTTLSDAMTDSQTTCPLTSLPTGSEGTLVIDPGTDNEEEIYYTSKGTGVVNIPSAAQGRGVNGTAKAHASGITVKMLVTRTSLDALKYAGAVAVKKKAGWDFLAASGTRASATTFTVTGDVTDKIAVGDKLELTDTTTKYFYVRAVAYGSPSTTITVTGGSDYTLVGNPSNIYYSKSSSPVGFPHWFNYTPTIASASGTAPTYTATFVNKFKLDGRKVTVNGCWINASGGTAGSGTNKITVTTPITIGGDVDVADNLFGSGQSWEDGGTQSLVGIICSDSTHISFSTAALAAIIANDQSSTAREIAFTYQYEI